MKTSTLTRHVTPTAIINAYQATCATIRRTYADLVAAERALNLALSSGGPFSQGGVKIAADRNWQSAFDQPEETIKRLRRGVWDQLVVRLELRKFLSVGRWRELQKLIEDDRMPEIDEESVGSFVQGLLDSRADIMADAVREVFAFLRPRGGTSRADYKTNSVEEVGPRVVLTWMVERGLGGLRLRYDQQQPMLALERVFQMLDGAGEISREHYSEIERAMRAGATSGTTPYFRWRAFAVGTLHITFVRRDLLARFNAVAGGKTLRRERAAGAGEEAAMVVAGDAA